VAVLDEQRRVLVTGGASGIGAEVARRLALGGWRVAVADLDADKASTVAAALPGSGHLPVHIDVADEVSVGSAFEEAEARVGPLRAVVHAAGVILTGPPMSTLPAFWDAGVQRWDRTMSINARGTYLVSAAFLRHRVRHPVEHGRLVLFSSVSGQMGGLYADYAASKAAVLGFMRVAARECAPLGITINAIAPGQIDTPMLRRRLPQDAAVDRHVIPVGRLGQTRDIASMVDFLLSDETDFITGATLDINGGQRMQ